MVLVKCGGIATAVRFLGCQSHRKVRRTHIFGAGEGKGALVFNRMERF